MREIRTWSNRDEKRIQHFWMTGNSIELGHEQRSRGGTLRRLSPRSCIMTSPHLDRAYRSLRYMPRILFRLLSQPAIIWCDISWKCDGGRLLLRGYPWTSRRAGTGNYRSHGVIIAIVIRSWGEAKKVRTRGSPINETCNVDLPPWFVSLLL